MLAFGSLALQVHLLMGRRGLLPAAEFVEQVSRAGALPWWKFPTIFQVIPPLDDVLWLGAWAGVALGLALAAGWRPRACLIALFVLWISYVTVGQDFFYFQWDNLLLEASFLSLFLWPGRIDGSVPKPTRFLLLWLLFRLYLESGVAKIHAGPAGGWHDLTAMQFYYETAPLPTWLGWWAHQMPKWAHAGAAASTIAVELMAPALIFGGPRARWTAFWMFSAVQIGIFLTGNYGYFNLLALILGLWLLDDEMLLSAAGRLRRWTRFPLHSGERVGVRGTEHPARKKRVAWAAGWAGAALVVGASLVEFFLYLAPPGPTRAALARLHEPLGRYRLVNVYHLFPGVTKETLIPEIQGTADGRTWKPYVFTHQRSDPARRPPFVAPHHPRVDFQAWFFFLGRSADGHRYFNTLITRLCQDPTSMTGLFRDNPFPKTPPLALRVAAHQYRMTDPETRQRTGAWYRRELLGTTPPYRSADVSPPAF